MENIVFLLNRNGIGIKNFFFRIIAVLFNLFSSINFSSSIFWVKLWILQFFITGLIWLSSPTNDSDLMSSISLYPSPVLFVLVINLSLLILASCIFLLLCSNLGLTVCSCDNWVGFCWYFGLSRISSLVRFIVMNILLTTKLNSSASNISILSKDSTRILLPW